jgi:hypothetical protein
MLLKNPLQADSKVAGDAKVSPGIVAEIRSKLTEEKKIPQRSMRERHIYWQRQP